MHTKHTSMEIICMLGYRLFQYASPLHRFAYFLGILWSESKIYSILGGGFAIEMGFRGFSLLQISGFRPGFLGNLAPLLCACFGN